ncbi:MAG: VWA domain-containing protein [Paracoccaceae bacterium]
MDNIAHFAHALRRAGIPVAPSQITTALEAVQQTGFSRRQDFYVTLRAALISRAEHLELYHQAFYFFWRDPEYLDRMMRMMLPLVQRLETADRQKPKPAERRAAEALGDGSNSPELRHEKTELEINSQFTSSQDEVLRTMDFEQMSLSESEAAKRAIQRLRLPVEALKTRRFVSAAIGRKPDVREVLRRAVKKAGELDRLVMKAPRRRPPNLIALCDISGSMSSYGRMMMHFLHALVWAQNSGWGRVHGFTFGTQLTNISRALHLKDVDHALQVVGRKAPDWQGGTQISTSLRSFNRDWSRRVLGQGAVVLLITDGLERGDTELLKVEVERLALSSRKLIWLNPLLRWEGFAPKAAGMRAILPFVDSFHSCHSVKSLSDLSYVLSTQGDKSKFRVPSDVC